MTRLIALAAAAASVLAACGSAGNTAIRAQSTDSTVSTTTSVETSTSPPSSAGFAAPKYGLSLPTVPDGFATLGVTREVDGPGQGWVHVYQEFRNDQTGESFIVAVDRGKPSDLSINDQNGTARGTQSQEQVSGHRTYFFDLRDSTGQLQYGWVMSPDVMGWITTSNMSAEATLALARQVVIDSPQGTP